MKALLEVKNLSKSLKKNFWNSSVILKNLSFSVPEGSVTGFLGANGSGKTTTFKCLFHFLKKDSGEIRFFGKDDFSEEVRRKIGFLPEHPQFYQDLQAEELLLFYGKLSEPSHSSLSLRKRVHQLLKEVDLYPFKDQKIKTFSKGMVQKIGLVQACLSSPSFLILDEPFSGLDPEGRFYIASLIEKMHQEGRTVFFSSHILQNVERLCDRLVILHKGTQVFEGDFASFLETIQRKRRISFLKEGQKKQEWATHLPEAQQKIKEIIQGGGSILSVQPLHSDLETAYKKLLSSQRGQES